MIAIHAFPASPRAFKALVAANHLGIAYELKVVDLTKGQQGTPEFAAKNPNKRMPVLEDDGFVVWESNAIIAYLADKAGDTALYPRDTKARANVLQWMFWESCSWDPACATLIFENFVKGFFGRGGPDPAAVAEGTQRFDKFAAVLDGQLKGRKFVCGDTLTLADFAIASPLIMTEPGKLPLGPYGEIGRWAAAMAELPAWKKTRAMQGPPPG